MAFRNAHKKWPVHGWIGLALIAVFWWLNWDLEGLRTHWGFFPLWFGYSLTVDALVFARKGDSLLTRSLAGYISLFIVSAPAWWLFEILNWRVQNWHYPARPEFTDLEYVFFASLSFSTVMPAVFGTAELMTTFGAWNWFKKGPRIKANRGNHTKFILIGLAMLALLMAWPRYFFPLLWLSVYFIVDGVNGLLGRRCLLDHLHNGDWRPYATLSAGCLVCGFFWEMWNFYSWPKWIYTVPFVDFAHLFEMPALGYLGYIPFAWELFALYHLVTGFLPKRRLEKYLDVAP